MTREEAKAKLNEISKKHGFDRTISAEATLDIYELFGFIKFDEQKSTNDGILDWCGSELAKEIGKKWGTVRISQWPEGLVLWVGGKIVWKSWEQYYKKGEAVTIEYYIGRYEHKATQAGIIK